MASKQATKDENLDEIAKKVQEKTRELAEADGTTDVVLHSDTWDIDSTFGELYLREPFLGTVSAGITKVADPKQPTAYVGVRPNGNSHEIILGYNPKFLREHKRQQRAGVVKHELFHVVLQHIFTRSIGEKSLSQLWNWATDMAINSLIGEHNLPDMCLLPGKRPIDKETGEPVVNPYADYIASAPLKQSSDFYFEELRRIQDEQGDSSGDMAIGSGIGTMDDHGGWSELPKDVQDQIQDKVRGLIEKGAERADRTNNWGSTPHDMQEFIRKMISKQIDWRSILRNFIGRTRTLERFSTVRKINKKMPYIHPGVRRPTRANFVAFIDQSGSMSDEDIAMLFGELENLSNLTEIDIYHFDTELDLDSHQVWKRGSPYPNPERTRCGGTDFQCLANFMNDPKQRGRWSGAIILTDGYAPKMGATPNTKVMWVVTETGTMSTVRSGDLAVQMSKEKKFKEY